MVTSIMVWICFALVIAALAVAVPALIMAMKETSDENVTPTPTVPFPDVFTVVRAPRFYVTASGSDGNDGKEEATAFATITKALDSLNEITWGGDAVINVGAGSFSLGVNPVIDLETTTAGSTLTIIGQVASFADLEVASISLSATAEMTDVTSVSGGHPINTFQDKLVMSAGDSAFVKDNTATVISLSGFAMQGFAAGTQFSVVDLVTNVSWTGGLLVSAGVSNLIFDKLNFDLSDASAQFFSSTTDAKTRFINSKITKPSALEAFLGVHSHDWGSDRIAGIVLTVPASYVAFGEVNATMVNVNSTILRTTQATITIPGEQSQWRYVTFAGLRLFVQRLASFFSCDMDGGGVLISNTGLATLGRVIMISSGTGVEVANLARAWSSRLRITSCVTAVILRNSSHFSTVSMTVDAATNGLLVTEGSSYVGINTLTLPAGLTTEVFLGGLGAVTQASVISTLNNDFAVTAGASQGCMVV